MGSTIEFADEGLEQEMKNVKISIYFPWPASANRTHGIL